MDSINNKPTTVRGNAALEQAMRDSMADADFKQYISIIQTVLSSRTTDSRLPQADLVAVMATNWNELLEELIVKLQDAQAIVWLLDIACHVIQLKISVVEKSDT